MTVCSIDRYDIHSTVFLRASISSRRYLLVTADVQLPTRSLPYSFLSRPLWHVFFAWDIFISINRHYIASSHWYFSILYSWRIPRLSKRTPDFGCNKLFIVIIFSEWVDFLILDKSQSLLVICLRIFVMDSTTVIVTTSRFTHDSRPSLTKNDMKCDWSWKSSRAWRSLYFSPWAPAASMVNILVNKSKPPFQSYCNCHVGFRSYLCPSCSGNQRNGLICNFSLVSWVEVSVLLGRNFLE